MKRLFSHLTFLVLFAAAAAGLRAQTVDVTYTYVLDGSVIGNRTVSETVGQAPTDAVPRYINATGYPETIEAGTTAYTITTSYNSSVISTPPNQLSFIKFRVNNNNYYWYAGETQGREQYNLNACALANAGDYTWKLSGDWLNGYHIQAGNGKWLTAPSATPANGSFSVFTDTPDDNLSVFMLEDFGTNGLRFHMKNGNSYLAHTSHNGRGLTFWNVSNYVGGYVYFEAVDEDFCAETFTSLENAVVEGVGYPAANHATTTAMKEAINSKNSYLSFISLKSSFATRLNNYLTCSEVTMPEDGKAYYLHNIQNANAGYLLSMNSAGTSPATLTARAYNDTNKDEYAKFVVHRLDNGSYILVNAVGGGYLVIKDHANGGYNSNQGFVNEYAANFCNFTMLPQPSAEHPGTFMLNSSRPGDIGNNKSSTFILTHAGAFNGYSNVVIWTNSYSNLFRLEEAEYPYNNVTLRTAGEADANWATLYLPFPTLIPEGVEAYTAARTETGLELSAVTGTLPRNEAVILRSETMNQACFIPSTEAGTENTENELQGTMEKAATPESGTYALGAPAGAVGFYRYTASVLPAGKAYYVAGSANENSPALFFSFGGTTTGIQTTGTTPKDTKETCHDLSGRRIARPAKGLYIRNGKKVFVK